MPDNRLRDADGHLQLFRGPAESTYCAQCPCDCINNRKPVPAYGAPQGLVIVGEGPGSEEIWQGYPFIGPAGRLLSKVCTENGIDRTACWLTNATLCARPRDDKDLHNAIDCCRSRLVFELQQAQPTTILALGLSAVRSLQLPVSGIADARGTVQESPLLPGIPVITSIHPAALLRGGAGEMATGGKQKMNVDAQYAFLSADLYKAAAIADTRIPSTWSDDITVYAPNASIAAKDVVDDVGRLLTEAREWGLLGIDLEWDIETRKITWIGIGTSQRSISLYFESIPPEALELIKTAMADETLPKLGHNGIQADYTTWEDNFGLGTVKGVMNDSMLMHHAACPGIAHDLQQVTSQYIVVPPWKAWHRAADKEKIAQERAEERRQKEIAKQIEKANAKAEKEAEKVAKAAIKEAEKREKSAKKKQLSLLEKIQAATEIAPPTDTTLPPAEMVRVSDAGVPMGPPKRRGRPRKAPIAMPEGVIPCSFCGDSEANLTQKDEETWLCRTCEENYDVYK